MTATFRPLDLISGQTAFTKEDGSLAPYGVRWLNKLRALFHRHDVLTATLTPSSVGANTVAEEAFSVTGAVSGAQVSVSGPAIGNATAPVAARVSDTDEVTIAFVNPTSGSLTPAMGTYIFHQVRP